MVTNALQRTGFTLLARFTTLRDTVSLLLFRTMKEALAYMSLFLVLFCVAEARHLLAPARSPSRHLKNDHMRERSRELYAQYKNRLATQHQPRRKVIFACDDKAAMCGGLGDRLKGLVTTFVLALLLDAEFYVSWETPVRLMSGMSDFRLGKACILRGWAALQVPLRAFFHLQEAFLLDAAIFEALAAEASDFDFTNKFIRESEMHRLRTTDFNEVFGDKSTMVVRVNGAIWYARCMDACLAALQITPSP